jgi:DNA-binding SARP family transcriptional activator
MAHLRLQALGRLTVSAGTIGRLSIPVSCRPILGYLIAHRRRRISRAELAETLWGEHDGRHARRCLSTALWRLKQSVRSGPSMLSFRGADEISLDWTGSVWVDSVALELRVQPLLRVSPGSLKSADIGRLQRGVRLYRGDFLVGIDDEWAALERQRLRDLYLDALYHLTVACAEARNWSGTLEWGRRLTQEDPLREDVHRLLMRAYNHTGNRAKALEQYRQCEGILEKELGVEPMAETQELHWQLTRPRARETAIASRDGARALPAMGQRNMGTRRAPAADQKSLGRANTSLAKEGPPTSVD